MDYWGIRITRVTFYMPYLPKGDYLLRLFGWLMKYVDNLYIFAFLYVYMKVRLWRTIPYYCLMLLESVKSITELNFDSHVVLTIQLMFRIRNLRIRLFSTKLTCQAIFWSSDDRISLKIYAIETVHHNWLKCVSQIVYWLF